MKLGEGGEAFFVFETSDTIPESLQTSPLISPTTSPKGLTAQNAASTSSWQEPEYLDLGADTAKRRPGISVWQQGDDLASRVGQNARNDLGMTI